MACDGAGCYIDDVSGIHKAGLIWSGLPMLMLLFRVGGDPWAIATSEVREVVPVVALQAMSQGWSDSGPDAWRAGLMNYRGETIPVVDVSALVSGRGTEQTLSTRIVVVALSDLSDGADVGQPRSFVGLMVAQVSTTAQMESVPNVPVVNRYVHSTWQSAEGGALVYRLATEQVAAQIYCSGNNDFSLKEGA